MISVTGLFVLLNLLILGFNIFVLDKVVKKADEIINGLKK